MDTTWTLLAGALIRLAAMGIGGFLCFLGYRLFSIVPLAHPGDAEFSGLKGTRIKLTRIGPGIFFAFFGTLMVILAINRPISYSETITDNSGGKPEVIMGRRVGAAGSEASISNEANDTARNLVEQEIGWLNQVESILTEAQRADLVHAPDYIVPRMKKRLMLSTWDSDAWGDASAFVQWLNETGGIGKPKDSKTAIAAEIYKETP